MATAGAICCSAADVISSTANYIATGRNGSAASQWLEECARAGHPGTRPI
jgi:hypothetical protein